MALALDPCHDQSQAGIGDEQWWMGNDLMNILMKSGIACAGSDALEDSFSCW
jgi:hypothetical protein